MKIAICSDIHDNIWVLERALGVIQEADVVLFCGDFCAPFTLVQLAEGFAGPIHVVWGNNDGDKFLLTRNASRFDHVHLHGELAELELGKMRVAMTHYPDIAQGLVGSDRYDLVCYGHDHIAHDEVVGTSRLLNPGELMGRLGPSTLVVLEEDSGVTRSIEIDNPR
jgi:putative phosphoesterase